MPSDFQKPIYEIKTSGTTGVPKVYQHSLETLKTGIKVGPEYQNAVWALLYPDDHLAGILVSLQATLNHCPLIRLYGKSIPEQIAETQTKGVTHLSATPSLMRQWVSLIQEPLLGIQQLTLGGEPINEALWKTLQSTFPNARLRQVYALTEAGTLLTSTNPWFKIPSSDNPIVKIQNQEIYFSSTIDNTLSWIATGDQIEFHPTDPKHFRIVGRKGNGVNIGGFWVSPEAVEAHIRQCPLVKDLRLSSRKNSVLGNILTAEVVFHDKTDLAQLNVWLAKNLPPYQIPRLIQPVDQITLTRTGKIQR